MKRLSSSNPELLYQQAQLNTHAETATSRTSSDTPASMAVELPKGLSILANHREPIEHLQLDLVPRSAADTMGLEPWEELEASVREALVLCPRLTSMVIRCETDAGAAFLDRLCAVLTQYAVPLQSLQLSFEGQEETPEHFTGLLVLIRDNPQLSLVCTGTLASNAAITYRIQHSVCGERLCRMLRISCKVRNEEHLIDRLCGLKNHDGHEKLKIELQLSDDSDSGQFIDSLLAAGVAPTLSLSVQTGDGYTVLLQDRIETLWRTHLDPCLGRFAPKGHLNCAELLKYCRSLEFGGPQLFAWVCSSAASSDVDEQPVVPIALLGYLRALDHLDAPFTVSCVLPADTESLRACDEALIGALCIDFGHMVDSDDALPIVEAAFERMHRITSCTVRHRAASRAFGDWLCIELNSLALRDLRLDLGNAEAADFSWAASQLLTAGTLDCLICVGRFAVSLFVHTAEHLDRDRPDFCPLLGLDLTPQTVGWVPFWLGGVDWPQLKLSINVIADQAPQASLVNLEKLLKRLSDCINVAWIGVSWSPQATGFTALKVTGAKRDIKAIMTKLETKDLAYRRLTMNAVLDAISDPLSEWSEGDAEQRRRIEVSRPHLSDIFGDLANSLPQRDMLTLGSLNRKTRQHFGLEIRLQKAAQRWAEDQKDLGRPTADYRPVLLELFGEQQTGQILRAVEKMAAVTA